MSAKPKKTQKKTSERSVSTVKLTTAIQKWNEGKQLAMVSDAVSFVEQFKDFVTGTPISLEKATVKQLKELEQNSGGVEVIRKGLKPTLQYAPMPQLDQKALDSWKKRGGAFVQGRREANKRLQEFYPQGEATYHVVTLAGEGKPEVLASWVALRNPELKKTVAVELSEDGKTVSSGWEPQSGKKVDRLPGQETTLKETALPYVARVRQMAVKAAGTEGLPAVLEWVFEVHSGGPSLVGVQEPANTRLLKSFLEEKGSRALTSILPAEAVASEKKATSKKQKDEAKEKEPTASQETKKSKKTKKTEKKEDAPEKKGADAKKKEKDTKTEKPVQEKPQKKEEKEQKPAAEQPAETPKPAVAEKPEKKKKKREKKERTWQDIAKLIITLAVFLGVVGVVLWVTFDMVISVRKVPDYLDSEDFTAGERIVFNRFMRTPHRGDLILVKTEEGEAIYRVIALDGDTIEIRKKAVYVNDELAAEGEVTRSMTRNGDYKFRLQSGYCYVVRHEIPIGREVYFLFPTEIPYEAIEGVCKDPSREEF